jgi:hypothetical protein
VWRIRTIAAFIILLGAWGGIVPFVGPLFRFGAGTPAWTWTQTFASLSVAAGAAVVIGGLMMTMARGTAWVGGALALAGGIWFVLGPVFAPLWHGSASLAAAATSARWIDVARVIGYHDGVGLLVAILAGYALGKLSELRRRVAAEPVAATTATMSEAA